MKTRIILLAILSFMMTACSTDKVKKFIPGTYINSASSEFSLVNDTLVIEQAEEESNNYLIHRKTGFKRIENGKLGKPEYETEEWITTYDENSKALNESAKGKLITFYPETNRLLIGKREYQKIN